ncbi:hypothetical protein HS088_TW20G00626 [Tripterygium wilfordii]|uniref:Uncharacterized protein n=1 Tax=Tripterygium wilfordii TaxID=458696 RepID=A0A7J7C7Y4_TRIWF|nr:uncharacterized protein LOC119987318 [Tripterygium wilfordii]KAF5730253.1 hypothetical protein HS088_TW20G00626 [Tripterygium wilfordii]
MVHISPKYDNSGSGGGGGFSPKRRTHGFIISIASIIGLCKKHADQASTKLKPKRLFNQISNKTVTLMQHKNRNGHDRGSDRVAADDFGDGGVWQREILMGDKCQPLDFSGVIHYDNTGKSLKEVPPRSPRASPLPGYMTRVK